MERQDRMILAEKRAKAEFDEVLLKTQLEMQEKTLKIVSEEIHDNIAQGLSLAKLNLNTMDPSNIVVITQKISDTKGLVSKAIQDLRDLSKGLNTDVIKEVGLMGAIEQEIESMRKIVPFIISIVIKGNVARLDVQKELVLYRLFQEASNNVVKHSDAGRMIVSADFGKHFELAISDDGKGFDVGALGNMVSGGQGVRNMRNRARAIGSELRIISAKQEGTRIHIITPLF
jgi:signal transduction histidine kinase